MRLLLPIPVMIVASVSLLFSCNNNSQESAKVDTAVKTAVEKTAPRERKNLSQGKGTLSFKLDGQLYETDPTRTKCWTTEGIPLVMMAAHGEGITVSWQMKYSGENTLFRADRDSKGGVSFKINDKRYWVRSVTGDNYLDVVFTEVKDKFSVKLLSGTFEGVLEDEKGNKVSITEGKFQTDDI